MFFAPQRRTLFRHLWSEPGVLCTFSLGHVLRATTACNFSSLIWPAGSAPVASASLLFDPPEPQIIGKTQCLATFLPFRASSSFFLLFPLLSASSLLCFSSVHIVGSLTSKLPSIIIYTLHSAHAVHCQIHGGAPSGFARSLCRWVLARLKWPPTAVPSTSLRHEIPRCPGCRRRMHDIHCKVP